LLASAAAEPLVPTAGLMPLSRAAQFAQALEQFKYPTAKLRSEDHRRSRGAPEVQ